VDPVAGNGSSEIVFEYALLTSGVSIVYKEDDTEGRIIRVVEVEDPVIDTPTDVLTQDLGDPEFYTAEQEYITYNFNGIDAVEVEAYYTKDLVNIPITAIDDLTEATDPPLGAQSPLLGLRKGEVTTVSAPSISDYSVVGSNSYLVIAMGATETFRYLSTVTGGVTVNVYSGSKEGPVIQSYVVTAEPGETVTVNPATISIAGYSYNSGHEDNRLSWRFGDADLGDGMDIRVTMTDIRATLNVLTKLGSASATLNSSELLATPYSKTVYAP
jgi:hypothetical protein